MGPRETPKFPDSDTFKGRSSSRTPASETLATSVPCRSSSRTPAARTFATSLSAQGALRRTRLALSLLAISALTGCRDSAPPVLSQIPAFVLTDQAGKPFGADRLAGRPFVANFIFTRCTTICPVFTAKMSEVQTRLKADGIEAHLVSFSVDPAYDTPERLAEYGAKHGADPSRWTFLTGDPDAIRAAVVEGLKISAQPSLTAADPAEIFHGSHFVLVDAKGSIRGYYDSADADATSRLLADLKRI